MAESVPSEVKKNDPELFSASLGKMTRFVAAHGSDYLTKDRDESDNYEYGKPHLYQNPQEVDAGRRTDGRSTWMRIDPESEGIDGTTWGSIDVLGEGPATRYGQFADLFLADPKQTTEYYYTFKIDGRVLLSEATIDYSSVDDGEFTKGEAYQIDDEKLREIHRMLDYMQPDNDPPRPVESSQAV